tara:strand:- start:7978 stop:8190 length:213 start_codon:yes stop_codon:yes gene_type:complete
MANITALNQPTIWWTLSHQYRAFKSFKCVNDPIKARAKAKRIIKEHQDVLAGNFSLTREGSNINFHFTQI